MNFDRVIWATWWIGTIMIVLSWFKIIPVKIGWIGFAISCLSVLAQVIHRKYWIPPKAQIYPDEISKSENEKKNIS